MSMLIEYLDRPPFGWFPFTVMRKEWRKWDWVVVMIDVPPDDYVAHRVATGTVRSAWVRIPGKHRNKDAACAALEDMIATRH
jgi:hypothetical protein